MKLVYLCWVLLVVVSTLILGQGFRLQVVEGKDQERRSQQNRFRITPVLAQRGLFYDVNGEPLVEQSDSERRYLYPEPFAHVLGYTGEADEEELILFGVDLGSRVGKLGLEKAENGLLHGTDGGKVEEYSAVGEKLRTLSESVAVEGRSIQLTIDKRLQLKAYQLLKDSGYVGSLVVSTPNGQILAVVSFPSYNANYFEIKGFTENGKDQWALIEELFQNERMPMFFRAIGGVYPPASTFKIVTAVAALEEGVIDERFIVEDTGVIKVGDFRYGNWYFDQYGKTEGSVNLRKALQRSNDIYFYKVGENLGIEKLAKWARIFGLGSSSEIAIEGEQIGLVPDPAWKQQKRNEDWYLGDTYITAIGQGNLQTSPVQVHLMAAVIANGGRLCTPGLVAAAVDKNPTAIDILNYSPGVSCKELPIAEQTIELIKDGMKDACDVGGTAWPLFNFKVENPRIQIDEVNVFKAASASASWRQIPVACKTGTAETGRSEEVDGKQKWFTHAWFTAFAPIHDPEIVVTVMLEDAGQGSDKAAPLAFEIFKLWFEEVRDD